MKSRWLEDGPDTQDLAVVLASGLHDGIHEDQIEDMQMQRVVGAQHGAQRAPQFLSANRVEPTLPRPVVARAPMAARVPAASPKIDARDWFESYYPKLQPQDLADFYRKKYSRSEAPVIGGGPAAFETYKRLLADRVKGQDIADRPVAELPLVVHKIPTPLAAVQPLAALSVPPLTVAPDKKQAAERNFPNTGMIAVLAVAFLLFGGLLGIELANPGEIGRMVMANANAGEIASTVQAILSSN